MKKLSILLMIIIMLTPLANAALCPRSLTKASMQDVIADLENDIRSRSPNLNDEQVSRVAADTYRRGFIQRAVQQGIPQEQAEAYINSLTNIEDIALSFFALGPLGIASGITPADIQQGIQNNNLLDAIATTVEITEDDQTAVFERQKSKVEEVFDIAEEHFGQRFETFAELEISNYAQLVISASEENAPIKMVVRQRNLIVSLYNIDGLDALLTQANNLYQESLLIQDQDAKRLKIIEFFQKLQQAHELIQDDKLEDTNLFPAGADQVKDAAQQTNPLLALLTQATEMAKAIADGVIEGPSLLTSVKTIIQETINLITQSKEVFGFRRYSVARTNLENLVTGSTDITTIMIDLGSQYDENYRPEGGVLKFVNDNYGHEYGDVLKQAFYETMAELIQEHNLPANLDLCSVAGTKGLELRVQDISERDAREAYANIVDQIPKRITQRAIELANSRPTPLDNAEQVFNGRFAVHIGITQTTFNPGDNIQQLSDDMRFKATAALLDNRRVSEASSTVSLFDLRVERSIRLALRDGSFATKFDIYVLAAENAVLALEQDFLDAVQELENAQTTDQKTAAEMKVRDIANQIKDVVRAVPRLNPNLGVILNSDVVNLFRNPQRMQEFLAEKGKTIAVGKSATGEELIAADENTIIMGDIDKAGEANQFTMFVQALYFSFTNPDANFGAMELGRIMDEQGIDKIAEIFSTLQGSDIESLNNVRQSAKGAMQYLTPTQISSIMFNEGSRLQFQFEIAVQDGTVDNTAEGLMQFLLTKVEPFDLSLSATAVDVNAFELSDLAAAELPNEAAVRSKATDLADEITTKVAKEILGRNTVCKVVKAKMDTAETGEFRILYHNDRTQPGQPGVITVFRTADGNYAIKYADIEIAGNKMGNDRALRMQGLIEEFRQKLGEAC